MAMIKENNYYTSYFTMEGLTAWIKTGEYRNTMNEIKEVITELVITKEDNRKDIIYKYISYNGFISYYWSKDGFSLSDVIEELLIYIAYNNIDKYWKDQFLDSVMNNQFKGLNAIKRFKKEYDLNLAEEQRRVKETGLREVENNLLIEANEIINKTNAKIEMRFNEPKQLNNYIYEVYTKNGYKAFNHSPFASENIELLNSMISWLKEHNDYLDSDLIPENFMQFDKVI